MSQKITLGIAILETKRKKKDLPKIINYLIKLYHINVIVFPDETIITEPISSWPICDALLCFYQGCNSRKKLWCETVDFLEK